MENDTDSSPLYPELPPEVEKLMDEACTYRQQANSNAALKLIDEIPVKYHACPQFLELKWGALQVHGSYEKALSVASFLCEIYPDILWGWLFKAESLAYLKRFDDAVNVLIESRKEGRVVLSILDLKIAAYRYAEGRHEEALEMLRDLFDKDPDGHMRRHAKNEPLLAAVWDVL